MATLSPEEIEHFRTQLNRYPPALKALTEIEDCEGNLADATISLAIRAGQQPQEDNAAWLADLAKRCRAVICQDIPRQNLAAGAIDKTIIAVANSDLIPPSLATPVILYVLKTGLEDFCRPLETPS
ncbi:hypothetical protein [Spirulina major]|uniref:hypothetical protein n=1 Tax=Spirulina major TaxID=270636 RepID=UPI00093346B3|nr:hypothetical protein [Spirulina major]